MTPARRARTRLLLALLALLAVTLFACGKKGDPQAPLPRGPRAVSDLAVEQEGVSAVLTFAYPDRLLTGDPLTDLDGIEIYRVVGPSPTITTSRKPPAGGAGGDRAPGAAERRAAQSVRLAEAAFYAESSLLERLPVPSLAPLTRGATLRYEDTLTPLLRGGDALAPIAYAVVSVRRNGERSPLSNIALLAPAVPPGPPLILRTTADEGRVCIEWRGVETDMAGAPLREAGYRVYRRVLPEEEYGPPLNPQPLAGTSFIDAAAPYGDLVYTVRATHPQKSSVEGLPAEEAPLHYRDAFPPPAPQRIDALPEGEIVRLLWDPVEAPDLAGYLVLRAEGTSAPAPLSARPTQDTFATDRPPVRGRRYRYTVVAIDAAGNRSAPSPEAIAEPF